MSNSIPVEQLDVALLSDHCPRTLDIIMCLKDMVRSLTAVMGANRHGGGQSELMVFEHGKKVHERTLFTPVFKGPLTYKSLLPIAALYSVQWTTMAQAINQSGRKYDLLICDYASTALSGLFLRKIGKVKHVAYWVRDYFVIHKRDVNYYTVKYLYNPVFKYCLNHADIIYYHTPPMKKTFIREGLLRRETPWSWLPNTIGDISPRTCCDPHAIGFIGHLHESHGIQLLLHAMPFIVEVLPDVTLRIVGTGPYEKILRDEVNKLGLEKIVRFYGYLEEGAKLDECLGTCAVGIAPFVPEYTYSIYGDPGKIKTYLKYGLPVIMTNVSYMAEQIRYAGAGLIVKYDKQDLANALLRLLGDEALRDKYRLAAIELAQKYNTKDVLSRVLAETSIALEML